MYILFIQQPTLEMLSDGFDKEAILPVPGMHIKRVTIEYKRIPVFSLGFWKVQGLFWLRFLTVFVRSLL